MKTIEYNGQASRSWKANLHAHSTTSDGRFSPAELIDSYQQAGYDVLAFSDHRKTNPVSAYDGRGMTLLSGIELHPEGPRGIPWHLLALGVPEDFDGSSFADGNAALAAARQAGALTFVAHPYWCGFTHEEVAALPEFDGIEVYNSSCRYIGKADSSSYWDMLLDHGRKVFALAVDDTHRKWDQFHGWTEIIAAENTPAALLNALKCGQFYATQGPVFTRISFQDGVFEAEFSPAVEVVMAGERASGFCGAVSGCAYTTPDPEVEGPVTHIRMERRDTHAMRYVRCRIRDAAGRYAWTNPFFLE